MRDYILVTGVPPGLAIDDRARASQGLKLGIGKQSAPQPWQITSVRPNTKTIYDEFGEVLAVAESWLMGGDFSDETWADDDEMHDRIAQVLADYLESPLPAIQANIEAETLSHEDVLLELSNNAVFWGEVI